MTDDQILLAAWIGAACLILCAIGIIADTLERVFGVAGNCNLKKDDS